MNKTQLQLIEEFVNQVRLNDSRWLRLLQSNLPCIMFSSEKKEISNLIISKIADETFSEVLNCYMKQRGIKKDIDLCRLANIDKGTFSGNKSGKHTPLFETLVKLIFALQLTESEIARLMRASKKKFNKSEDRDLVILYFIENKIYDLHKLNAVLKKLELKTI